MADLLPKDEQQRVIFIPHQELFLVPFVALQDENHKYLIEKHTILTAPSIQVLSLSQTNKQSAKKPNAPVLPRGESALIVGNPTMPKGGVGEKLEPLEQLPGAEQEAKQIAQMLNTKPIIGDEATESTIVQKMASAELIHLATHGLLDDTNAIGSPGAIALTPDDKNNNSLLTPDDKYYGFLTTSEIMERFGLPGKFRLNADLIVLSA
ncbi:MAG: CHAT domain-containing protein, partial [Rivularia sp. ALOHA_DT_140]|nr:CHAT domain-containing protein [Rivularia sp. ALOHA_DT_140]